METTTGFYATNYTGRTIFWNGDIMTCKRKATKIMRSLGCTEEEFGIYDAEMCEQVDGDIFPKANAVPIWIYRVGAWHTNPEYIY